MHAHPTGEFGSSAPLVEMSDALGAGWQRLGAVLLTFPLPLFPFKVSEAVKEAALMASSGQAINF
jgi:hypothetical protein